MPDTESQPARVYCAECIRDITDDEVVFRDKYCVTCLDCRASIEWEDAE